MAKHHARRVVLDPAQCDDPPPLQLKRPPGHGKALEIKVKRWFRILQKNPLPPPVPKKPGGTGVSVFALMVVGVLFTQDDPHQVMRTRGIVTVLHFWSDLVIGLGHDLWYRDPARVIAEGTKRLNMGHRD